MRGTTSERIPLRRGGPAIELGGMSSDWGGLTLRVVHADGQKTVVKVVAPRGRAFAPVTMTPDGNHLLLLTAVPAK